MQKKPIVFLLFVVLSLFTAACDSGAKGPALALVQGVVEDIVTGEKVAGLTVELDGRRVTTAADGTFAIGEVEHGHYTLSVYDGSAHIYTEIVNVAAEITQFTVGIDRDPNRVGNSGFEQVDSATGFAHGWERRQFDPVVEYFVDRDVVRTGNLSVRMVGRQSPGTSRPPRGAVRRFVNFDAPTAGEAYKFGAWFKSQGVSGVKNVEIRLTFTGPRGNIDLGPMDSLGTAEGFKIISPGPESFRVQSHLLNLYPETLPALGEWEPIEAIIVPPNGATRVLVELFLWESVGTLWWDDVVVEPIE